MIQSVHDLAGSRSNVKNLHTSHLPTKRTSSSLSITVVKGPILQLYTMLKYGLNAPAICRQKFHDEFCCTRSGPCAILGLSQDPFHALDKT